MTRDEAGLTPLPLPISAAAAAAAAPYRPRVEITFEYTFDELREGLTHSPEQQQEHRRQTNPKRLLGWMLFGALAVFFFLLLTQGSPSARRPVPRPPMPTVDLLVAVGPSVLVALLVSVAIVVISMAIRMMMDKSRKTRDAGKRLPTTAVLFVVFIGFGGAGALWAQRQPSGWSVSYRLAMTLALLPWIFVIALALASVIWLNHTNFRIHWQARPYLRRRRTIVLDADGERSRDDVTDLLYRWPHFRQAWETANLLVLLDENELRHILPKRVMDPAALERARSLISNHVAEAHFLTTPGGFPVATPARPPEPPSPAPASPR